MKTSLNIDDSLYDEAQKESLQTGKTLSETITEWAREGRRAMKASRRVKGRHPKALSLGGPASVDLSSRRDWMDVLDG